MGTQGNVIVAKIDAGFIKIGAYSAAEGACVDIGYTEGGIEIIANRKYYDVEVDQELGFIDSLKYFEEVMFKFSMVEPTFENLLIALDQPSTSLVANQLSFGGDKTANKKTMYINITTPSGMTYKFKVYKVVAISSTGTKFVKNNKTVIAVEVRALQDTSQTANKQCFIVDRASADTTPPTVVITTPASGGTVAKTTLNPVVLTLTETNAMNENSIVYGDTINILNITNQAAPVEVAGTTAYDKTAKTITFTPSVAWNASDKMMITVSKGLMDNAGNHLAATYVDYFTVTA